MLAGLGRLTLFGLHSFALLAVQHPLRLRRGHPDQYHLALEDIETAMAVVHAEDEAIDPPETKSTERLPAGAGRIRDMLFQVPNYDVLGDGAVGG